MHTEPVASARNWFSPRATLSLYKSFLELDSDKDGRLSAHEFAAYGGGGLTPLFIARVFEEHVACHPGRRAPCGEHSSAPPPALTRTPAAAAAWISTRSWTSRPHGGTSRREHSASVLARFDDD